MQKKDIFSTMLPSGTTKSKTKLYLYAFKSRVGSDWHTSSRFFKDDKDFKTIFKEKIEFKKLEHTMIEV